MFGSKILGKENYKENERKEKGKENNKKSILSFFLNLIIFPLILLNIKI